MKFINRITTDVDWATTFCILGIILVIFVLCYGAVELWNTHSMQPINQWIEQAAIVETFYTVDRYGRPIYNIMWESANYADIFTVCSSCYSKYKDAKEISIRVTELDSKNVHGYNYCLHNHYAYERTNK